MPWLGGSRGHADLEQENQERPRNSSWELRHRNQVQQAVDETLGRQQALSGHDFLSR